jgi:hypothetical protein
MSDDYECGCVLEHALKRTPKYLGIECRKALVQDGDVCVLEERTRDVDAATLAVRQLPTRFSDHLHEARRHPLEQ